ncbi:MAG: CsbD family protein [Coriobacteriia bacterium]|nr:CsbD family protein [Coriobacteriia bacterium]
MSDHKGEEMKGRVKEAAGNLTADKDLEREGKKEQRNAKVKKTVDDAAEKIKNVVDGD